MAYLAVYAPPEANGQALAQAQAQINASCSWRLAGRTASLRLWTSSDNEVVRPLGAEGFVIGEIYDASDGRPWVASPRPQRATSSDLIASLCAHAFGRYVAILGTPAPCAFRDPSGGRDCLVWQNGPLTFVCDDLEQAPSALRPPRLALDWNVIARLAAAASLATAELALEGAYDVMPGTSRSMAAPALSHTHWTPAQFLRRKPAASNDELAEALAERVDIAVKALLSAHERLMVEVSGGLDSAILAGAIARLGIQERVAGWLNYFTSRPEGDERAYARSVTDRIGATLTCAHLPVRALTEADFKPLAKAVRPAFNALVPERDKDAARRMLEMGATGLVSGQGGDAVFYQMPSALIWSDEIRSHGLSALTSPLGPAMAQRLRRSLWSVLCEALGEDRPKQRSFSITAVPREVARRGHPWTPADAKLSPAKRLQIIALANAHVATGKCRIAESGSLLYPLTAQPVAEFCLGVPAATLTAGGRERGLARHAFADRVPAMVLRRRKKGELTAFHAQTVAASLDFLRPYLLDGTLAQAGVLDRRHLEVALNPEQLFWRGEGSELLVACALEAWVRHWQCYAPDSVRAGRQLWGERAR